MVFVKQSESNYTRLKKMVEEGLKLAEETHEYKEAREYLKKIQGEFRGIKMVNEQREELYSRLQTAFDILNKRVDDFFRNKKKNWETKMTFTLARFDADIFELEQAVKKEEEFLEELLDQLDIVSSGNSPTGKIAMQARIHSVRMSIEQNKEQIIKLRLDREELRARLEQ